MYITDSIFGIPSIEAEHVRAHQDHTLSLKQACSLLVNIFSIHHSAYVIFSNEPEFPLEVIVG